MERYAELGALAGDRPLYGVGERALRVAASRAVDSPFGSGLLLVVLDHAVGASREVVIAGDPADPRTRALWDVVRPTAPSRVLPVRIGADGAGAELAARYPALENKRALEGEPIAYVCEIGSCQLPTSDSAVLAAQLAEIAVR